MSSILTGSETKFEGKFGWAQDIPISPKANNAENNLAAWLIYAPNAHPIWAFHILSLLRLDDECVRLYENATHEILVLSLDPEFQPYSVEKLSGDMAQKLDIPYITPADFVGQITATDEQAKLLIVYAARACTVGHLIPDEDYRPQWSAAVEETLQHITTGGHG